MNENWEQKMNSKFDKLSRNSLSRIIFIMRMQYNKKNIQNWNNVMDTHAHILCAYSSRFELLMTLNNHDWMNNMETYLILGVYINFIRCIQCFVSLFRHLFFNLLYLRDRSFQFFGNIYNDIKEMKRKSSKKKIIASPKKKQRKKL